MATDGTTRKFVFSPHPCIDGVASAWALQQAFPQADVRYQGLSHNERENLFYNGSTYAWDDARSIVADALRDQPRGQDVYFVDYVPNDVQIIEDLLDAGHKVTIYDHHQTARDNLSALERKYRGNPAFSLVFDDQKSGATITWAALHPDTPPPQLLTLIQKMDLLTFDNDQERLAACYIDGYVGGPDQEENIANFKALFDEYRRGGLEALALKGAGEYAAHAQWVEDTRRQRPPPAIGRA